MTRYDRRWLGHLAVALSLCIFGGCGLNQWVHNGFKVGPNYSKPAVPVAPHWIDYRNPDIKSVPVNLACWWMVFNDSALNDLVVTASRQNINLRVAGMRILESRYRRAIAVGEPFPQLQETTGSATRNKISTAMANTFPGMNSRFNNVELGFNAMWELDFWGRFRRAVEVADAELDVSIENYDDVMVMLLAEVASAYVELRTFQQRLSYATNNVASQEGSLRIAEDKLRNGVATQRDVEQARTVLEQTRALVPEFESGVRLASNRLCILLGIPPWDLAARLGQTPIPKAPPEVAVGIPADLVRRRPDVRRAEREVAAQSARIGIAQSDLYPHITINGTFGWAAQSFGDLFDGNRSTFGSVGPAFRWDILNYGRLLNAVKVQDAIFQETAYAYQQKVLEAGREAEDGIVRFLKSQRASKSLDLAERAAAATRDITTNQYRQGVVEFTAVYIAESELAQVQDRAAGARGAIAQSLIALYRALGGGWEIRLSPQGGPNVAAGPSPVMAEPDRRPELPEPAGAAPALPPPPPAKTAPKL
jgi:NodT family efflux transporter outer membrane factor (OMF) lipoprotein